MAQHVHKQRAKIESLKITLERSGNELRRLADVTKAQKAELEGKSIALVEADTRHTRMIAEVNELKQGIERLREERLSEHDTSIRNQVTLITLITLITLTTLRYPLDDPGVLVLTPDDTPGWAGCTEQGFGGAVEHVQGEHG